MSSVKIINSGLYGRFFTKDQFIFFDQKISDDITLEGQKIIKDLQEKIKE